MRIVIETIPHSAQRYPTLGDYWVDRDGTLQIRVSEFVGVVDDENAKLNYPLLIALHELIEQALCLKRGISEESITAFDMAHLGADDPWVDDPGHCPQAPYHREHVFAECIERLFAAELGVNWQAYTEAVEKVDR
jgi:hypothetical protein